MTANNGETVGFYGAPSLTGAPQQRADFLGRPEERHAGLLCACSVMTPKGKSVILVGFVSFQWTTFCTGRGRAPAFFVHVPGKGDIPTHGRHMARRVQRTPLFSAAGKADATQKVRALYGIDVFIHLPSRGCMYILPNEANTDPTLGRVIISCSKLCRTAVVAVLPAAVSSLSRR